MNRELKFRAWDTDNKKWLDQPDFCIWQGKIVTDTCLPYIDKNLIVQQYTNANDKNNKEIYEGDIVNYRGRIGQVEYFAAMYICSWNDQTDDELSHMIIGDIEVIGNVFENPELLNSVPPPAEEDEEENEDLSSCENCGERGWDGRICHICGAKHI